MIMEMENRLSGIGATIYDYSKAFVCDSLLLRELRGHTKNLAHERSVSRTEIQKRGDMFSRYDQNMNRRLATDVLKSHHGFVFVNQFPFDFSLYDATKKAVVHRTSFHQSLRTLREAASRGYPLTP